MGILRNRIVTIIRTTILLLVIPGGSLLFAEVMDPALNGVKVESILIESTVFTKLEINAVLQPYLNRTLYIEDLQDLARQITRLYVARGYLNSGAQLPEQDLSTGTLRIRILEGDLSGIEFTDSGRLSRAWIESLIMNQVSHPLNVADLQRAFSRLELDPKIDHIKGQLQPGVMPGESVLRLTVFEADPFNVAVSINNHTSPSVGSEQVQLRLNHINLLGHGDELHLGLNKTQGVGSGSLFYRFPITDQGTKVALYYSKGDTLVVEEPFDEIDLESETNTKGIRLSTQLGTGIRHGFELSIGLEKKTSVTSLLGIPFDFGQGSMNGESKAAVVELSAEYARRQARQALIARVLIRKGLDAMGATSVPGGLDGKFQVNIIQLDYVRRLGANTSWRLAVNVQKSRDTLQAFERYALGGVESVRGFRENRILKDNAWEVMTELEIPLRAGSGRMSGEFTLSLVPFAGMGRGWNTASQPNVNRSESISSVGLGLRLFKAGLSVQLDWAKRLSNTQKLGNDLQDHGVHLGVSYVF